MGIGLRLLALIPEKARDTFLILAFGWWKIPLIAFVRPRVIEMNDDRLKMLIPLRRRTKNHLGSMYFGALMIGADAAAGYYAAKLIWNSGEKIDFVFKSAQGLFLKRPTGDVVFTCEQGAVIRDLVQRSLGGERVDAELKVFATVPSLSPDVVAEMTLVLSLKKRKN
ncbi:MAG: DUF4442 domain-containing protein [Chitinophagaceae bacterium]|nr:DUF4442 domain-containing protein [Oligoflexus sp.]